MSMGCQWADSTVIHDVPDKAHDKAYDEGGAIVPVPIVPFENLAAAAEAR